MNHRLQDSDKKLQGTAGRAPEWPLPEVTICKEPFALWRQGGGAWQGERMVLGEAGGTVPALPLLIRSGLSSKL